MSTIEDYIRFEAAIRHACEHLPVTSVGDFKPELAHSLGTGFRLLGFGYDGDVVIAGMLNEFLEETTVSKEDIEKIYGAHVANIIQANTKNPLLKDPTEKVRDIAARCNAVGEDALVVKAADIIDNYEYFVRTGNTKEAEVDISWGKILLEYVQSDAEIFRVVGSLGQSV